MKSIVNDFRRGTTRDSKNGLVIDYGRANCRILEASDLASLIRHFPGRLALISLANVRVVVGTSTTGTDLTLLEALANCRFLKSFELHSASLEEIDAIDLGSSLARLPLLGTFSVRGGEVPFFPAVARILQAPTHALHEVSLTQFSTYDDDTNDHLFEGRELEDFFEAAAASTTLKSLVFCPYSQQGALPTAPQQQESLVANLIQQSSTLASLTLCLHPRTDLRSVAAALRHNTCLEELVIQRAWALVPPSVPEQEAKAFHTTLQEYNTTLQKLRVTSLQRTSNQVCRAHWDATAFYLTLNRMGRKRLLGTAKPASTSEWIQAISFQEDPSIVYWFLRRNPSLCRGAGEEPTVVASNDLVLDPNPSQQLLQTKKRERAEEEAIDLATAPTKKRRRSLEPGLRNALTYTAMFAAGYWFRGSA